MVESLYIHIPFCHSICSYCDFCRVKYNPRLAERYLNELYEELKEKCSGSNFKTIYIGGGTPSALSMELLADLLDHVYNYSDGCEEFTIEANPESLDQKKIELFKKMGVNRISLGVQAVQKRLLTLTNRKHTVDQIKECISWIHEAGIVHISVDLIYSLPTQTKEEWLETLNEVLKWDIDHISLYSLTIEENSEFARKGYQPLDEETEADMYEMACSILKEKGYFHYEISNFAKENGQSMHNKAYWHYDDYIGVGMGASGKVQDLRYDNTTVFPTYFDHKWCQEEIHLSKQDQMFEMIMMGLRLKEGIRKELFYQRYKEDLSKLYRNAIDLNVEKGWLIETEDRIFPTDAGLACLNDVLMEFMD